MKRSQIKRRPLADTVLEKLEPETSEYREMDSPGLYFRVKPNGSKSWSLRYKRPNGKWAWKGLGPFPRVSGKAARESAGDLLKLSADGIDLATYQKDPEPEKKEEPPFRELAEDWYDRRVAEGLAPKTLRLMRDALDKDLLPPLGDIAITEVSRGDCTDAISDIEERGAWHIAKKARGWLNNMYSLAIAQGRCELNPASELRHVARKTPATKHHPHLLEPELPAFMKALETSCSQFTTRVAVRMVLLTASRPGMVRLAEWEEIDLDNALWSVDGIKMKMDRDHLVPLPRQLVSLLESLKELTGMGRYVFPGKKANPYMSHQTINSSLRAIGYKDKLVGHGARHTASTLLNDHGWRDTYVEMQLAHKVGGVKGVYNKAKYLEQRTAMMQWYADYLDALRDGTAGERKEEFKAAVIR